MAAGKDVFVFTLAPRSARAFPSSIWARTAQTSSRSSARVVRPRTPSIRMTRP